MLFVVLGYDRAKGGREIRARTRAAHIEFVFDNRDVFRYGGALLDEKGGMIGTIAVIEAPNRPALDRMLAEDPYNRAGLFESMIVHSATQLLPELVPGTVIAEIERARAHVAKGRHAVPMD